MMRSWIWRSFFVCVGLGIVTLEALEEKYTHAGPVLSTTAILEVVDAQSYETEGVVLIKRGKAPFGIALPGGRVESGETVEEALQRELLEELNIEAYCIQQFHVYSQPERDPRHHTVEVTHIARVSNTADIKAGDDAEEAMVVSWRDIPWNDLAFDHTHVLVDFLGHRLVRRAFKNANAFWFLSELCESVYQKAFCVLSMLALKEYFFERDRSCLEALFQAAICESICKGNEQNLKALQALKVWIHESAPVLSGEAAWEELAAIDSENRDRILIFLKARSNSGIL